MNDEKYLFIQDVRDKKRTARSSHNRRTHAGKSGGVKLPSDYLTKKEREKMNGEPTTYRINSPMTWDEFKAIPDDLKVLYVGWIRDTFGATDKAIAEMLGVDKAWFSKTMRSLGAVGPKRGPRAIWDVEAFTKWRDETKVEAAEETEAKEEKRVTLDPFEDVFPIAPDEVVEEIIETPTEQIRPASGYMLFDGPADQSLRVLGLVLGNKNVRMRVSWETLDAEANADG